MRTLSRQVLILVVCLVAGLGFLGWWAQDKGWLENKFSREDFPSVTPLLDELDILSEESTISAALSKLSIASLREGSYPGSDLVVEERLSPGRNYQRYRVSYQSEGLKIYALLTIPQGTKPENGWPVIVFNHGYIPPDQYRTTERYVAYTDAFSRNGYMLIRPDYRGHGSSEGVAAGGYGSNEYTIDVLNALASVQRHPDVDRTRVGMWGHSMGGFITLRSMVVRKDIKAGVIWGGVVASYPDLLRLWRRPTNATPFPVPSGRTSWRQLLTERLGDPEANTSAWAPYSANSFLSDISGPVQLHHGTADDSVPVEFSEILSQQLQDAGKTGELFTYQGDDHNLSQNLSRALQRSVDFFDQHVKGE